jgi:RecA/RadA recombinase
MPSVSTGLPQIDALLGGSGLRPGRIVEFVGLPGSGKSALTYDAAKNTMMHI